MFGRLKARVALGMVILVAGLCVAGFVLVSSSDAAVKKNLQKDPALKELLPQLAAAFATLDEFTHDSTEASLRRFADEKGVKAGLLINATRTALTGQAVGPGLFDVVAAVGKDRTVARLKHAAQLV